MTDNGSRTIVVLVENEDGRAAHLTYELLAAGKDLADALHTGVAAIVAGHDVGVTAESVAGFADTVYVIDDASLAAFQPEIYASVLCRCLRDLSVHTIIMGHTLEKIDLAPRIACALGGAIATDVVKVGIDASGVLCCEKPVYGDKATARFALEAAPRIVTIRPRSIPALETAEKKGTLVSYETAFDPSEAKIAFIESMPGESVDLDKAEAVVSGGRGFKERESLHHLDDLAGALRPFFPNVEIGASRPLVDNGFFEPSRQVGLTGEKVTPELYIAVAISGASQHLSGITGSKTIVAINKDEGAAIFESSDYGVVGDYEKVIPALVRKLKEL